MKNEFILHFSAIPIARLVPPPEKGGPVTGSLRDLYTLEWGAEHPVTPAEAARLKALAKLDAVEVLSRLGEYEAALSGEGEAVSAAVGEYRRGRDGYWRQRRVKFPANVLLEGGRAAAFVTPCREVTVVLVRSGLEGRTPLALWADYQGEALSPVEPVQTFRIPTSDGTAELATDVYLPAARRGPVPALLIRTPYNREEGAESWLRYVCRGYALVIQDVRGKGESTGAWVPHSYEVEDGTATLEWMAAQDWCDGCIGTAGGSYLGYVQWAMAAGGSPHLKAMISVVTAGSGFVDLPRRGGCYVSGMFPWAFSVSGQRFDASLMERPDWDKVLKHRPLRELPEKALGRPVPFLDDYLDHRDYDEFWRRGNWAEEFQRRGGRPVPVFIQSGWFDDNGMGTTEALDLTRDWPHRKVILGPWQHSGNSQYDLHALSFGEDALRFDLDLLHLRWLERFLRGQENGVEKGPAVEYYTTGEERWHTAGVWPPAQGRLSLWPDGQNPRTSAGDGVLLKAPPAKSRDVLCLYDPMDPAHHIIDMSENELEVPEDYTQEEGRQDYLCYTTSPLEEPLTVTGDCQVELFLLSDGEDADAVVRLCDVFPDGRSVKLADGVLSARYREGFDSPRPLTPGQPMKLVLRTTKLSHRFLPGHRLRLTVTFSAEGFILPSSGTAAGYDSTVVRQCRNGLRTGGCVLHLPVPGCRRAAGVAPYPALKGLNPPEGERDCLES